MVVPLFHVYKYYSGFLVDHSSVHYVIKIVYCSYMVIENYETSCHIVL